MTKKIDWRRIRKEVFNRGNLITVLVVGFFPPIIGAVQVLGGIETGHKEDWDLSRVFLGWVYSYIVTATLFYGSAFIIHLLNETLPWKGNISKRVFLEALLVLSFTSLAQISLLYILEDSPLIYIRGKLEFKDYLQNVIFSNTITIIVVALVEGNYFFRNWRETLIASEKLKKEHAESQLANLRSQLDPHFMFNSLNVLIGLIRQNPKKAESFVEDFSRVYRHMLEVNNRMVVPLQEEINFTKQYLRLQQTRFEEGLKVNWKIAGAESEFYLPPLSLQEVISNAIKHNVIDAEHPLKLEIELEGEDIKVRNNLNLRLGKAESTGLGLANIRDRYELLKSRAPSFIANEEFFQASLPLLKLES